MSAQGSGAPEAGQPSADQLAAMVANASDEQIAEGMASEARPMILGEIFRRMAEHLEPNRAAGVDAVVHWKILDRPDGGYDHYEIVIRDGKCSLSEVPGEQARVTLRVKPVEFMRLVTGSTSGPELFIRGKLRIEGDLMFAARIAGMFQIPRPTA